MTTGSEFEFYQSRAPEALPARQPAVFGRRLPWSNGLKPLIRRD